MKKLLYKIIVLALVTVAVGLLFSECIQWVTRIGSLTHEYQKFTGFQATFGYKAEGEVIAGITYSEQLLNASTMNIIGLVLAGVGALLVLIKVPFGKIISSGCLVASGVLFAFMGKFSVLATDTKYVEFKTLTPAYIITALLIVAGLINFLVPDGKKRKRRK